MGNNIVVWRMKHTGETLVERVLLLPPPISLDDATQRLPGGGYTTFRTFDRFRVLRLNSHFIRLEETARLASNPVELDQARFAQALHEAVSMYPANDVRVRVILDLEKQPGTIYILIEPLHTPKLTDYQQGVKVVTRSLQRTNPKAKLTNFIGTAEAVRRDLPPGVNEAIMVSADGHLLEGLSSNFYAVKDGILWTAEKDVLSGITRSLVLDVVREAEISLKLEGVLFEDLPDLEEAFITSASRAVLPVAEIDGQLVGCGRPGPITNRMMGGYQARLEKELDWL